MLGPRDAGILLLVTRRAVEAGGCLLPADVETDSIGKAAFAVYGGESEGTLSEVIEEVTGAPSTIDPSVLADLVRQTKVRHAMELGMPEDEALAQIAA